MRKLSLALAAPLAVVAIPNGANTAAADPAHAATRSTAPMPPTAVRPSAVAALRSTIDPNSNIRLDPYLDSPIVFRTRALTPVDIYCYAVGDFHSDGRHSTRIWYNLSLVGQRVAGFAWGGNVNTRHDPPPGMYRCQPLPRPSVWRQSRH